MSSKIVSQAVIIFTEYEDDRLEIRSVGSGECERTADEMVNLFRVINENADKIKGASGRILNG